MVFLTHLAGWRKSLMIERWRRVSTTCLERGLNGRPVSATSPSPLNRGTCRNPKLRNEGFPLMSTQTINLWSASSFFEGKVEHNYEKMNSLKTLRKFVPGTRVPQQLGYAWNCVFQPSSSKQSLTDPRVLRTMESLSFLHRLRRQNICPADSFNTLS